MGAEKVTRIVKNESYGQKIYQQLKGLIVSGQLRVGSPINEREFSDQLGVSRTPLRDALNLLEQEGWIEQDGKARKVALLHWRDMLELVEVRGPLGMLALNMAFDKITDADIEHLEGILEEMSRYSTENSQDYYNIMRLDTSFHSYITQITGNSLLIRMDTQMSEKYTRANVLSMLHSNPNGQYHASQHNAIMDALRGRDRARTYLEMQKHYNVWANRMKSLPEKIGFDPEDLDAVIYEQFIKSDK